MFSFNDKEYSEVNREERFFCFLFAHALLSSNEYRIEIVNIINEKLKHDCQFCARNLEVYIETAVIRDYWNDLGDPNKYNDELHAKRKEIILQLINPISQNNNDVKIREEINNNSMFWTKNAGSGKLQSPGKWTINQIDNINVSDEIKLKLKNIKWAFNAKPDIMLISGDRVLMIEAKLESKEGKSSEGYNQYETLKNISSMIVTLVPSFKNMKFSLGVLSLDENQINKSEIDFHISWKEIIEKIDNHKIDEFTKKNLQLLHKRYYKL